MKSKLNFRHIFVYAWLLNALSVCAQTNQLLPETYIYGTGFQESIKNALPQTEIITSSAIRNSGLTSVGDILQKLGNVFTRQDLSGNLNSSIDIRGYGATSDNNVLVLIDGIRLSENQQSSARIWTVPVELIDHIEIVRGSSSVLFGESATSGVINIITNKQRADLAVLSGSIGSYGTYQSNAYASKNISDLQISAYEKTLNSKGFREQNDSQIRTGGLNLDYNLTPTMTGGLKLATDTNNSILPGGLTQSQFAQNPKQPQYPLSSLPNPNTFDNKNDVISSYLKIVDGNTQYFADLFRRVYSLNANYGDPYSAYATAFKGYQEGLTLRSRVSNFLISGSNLTYGIDASSWQRDSGASDLSSIDTIHATQRGGGGFIQEDLSLTNVDRITAGYRSEFFNKTINDVTNAGASQGGTINLNAYELQFSRSIDTDITSYAKIAQSYRLPNVDDLKGSPCASYGVYTCLSTSLGLLPQINKDYELGIIQSTAKSKGSAKIYRSNIDNEVVFDAVSFNNINAYKTYRQGIELAEQYKSTDNLTLRGELNLIQAKFLTDSLSSTSTGTYNKNISGVPSYVLNTGFDLAIDNNQSIGFIERVTGTQYAQGDNTNQLKLGAYAIADLSYRYSIPHWLFTANVNNIFNRKYFDTAIYADFLNPVPHYSVYPNPDRNIYLNVRYSF